MAITSTALKNVGTEAVKFAIVTPSGHTHIFITSKSNDGRVQFLRHLDGAESKYIGLLQQNGELTLTSRSAYPNITEDGQEKVHYIVKLARNTLRLVYAECHEQYERHGFETRLLEETEEAQQVNTSNAQNFVSDLFLFAMGMGMKSPKLRVHFKNMRFKIDVKRTTGTIRVWSGNHAPGS